MKTWTSGSFYSILAIYYLKNTNFNIDSRNSIFSSLRFDLRFTCEYADYDAGMD